MQIEEAIDILEKSGYVVKKKNVFVNPYSRQKILSRLEKENIHYSTGSRYWLWRYDKNNNVKEKVYNHCRLDALKHFGFAKLADIPETMRKEVEDYMVLSAKAYIDRNYYKWV